MLARRRDIKFPDGTSHRTPILLPSFSSKGFPTVEKIFKASEEYISDEILVSAYDISHKHLKGPFDFPSLVFLDSGGYEASTDTDLSETYEKNHKPLEWSPERHQAVLDSWDCTAPTVFVTYDGQKERTNFRAQIDRALDLRVPDGGVKDFLIKPESSTAVRLDIGALLPLVGHLDHFHVIGVTEKEIGNSLLNRMVNVAKLRRTLDIHAPETPIHVFGSLDTFSTFLYFLAGADIFDGLTWLRYAFYDGDTIYRHNFGALTLPIKTNSDIVEGRCWSHNYQYMVQMQLDMMKFVADQNFSHFGKYADKIEAAYKSMMAELES